MGQFQKKRRGSGKMLDSSECKQKLEDARKSLEEAQHALWKVENEVAWNICPEGHNHTQLAISSEWECEKSPIGWCVFEHHSDCLFCHEPQERK